MVTTTAVFPEAVVVADAILYVKQVGWVGVLGDVVCCIVCDVVCGVVCWVMWCVV